MSRRGFTLIETATALFVLAAVVSLGTASFLELLPKFRLQGAAWEVAAKLNEARLTALLRGTAVRWRAAGNGYVLEMRDPDDGSWKRLGGRRPPGVLLRANNAPVFHPRGTVSNLATIVVENSRGLYRITLAITGRVKVVKA
ncbi:MAG: prepilin-type N-terminal cleavage/methylation domain-containing protein [Candidatus Aminicenantes bacterium]|nr:prepilin-type N-terminal cleavage/methylation domain-containing protein [Candidatus Aminicenantes bacterium]